MAEAESPRRINCGHVPEGACFACAQQLAVAGQSAAPAGILGAGVRRMTDEGCGKATLGPGKRGLAAVEIGKGPGRPDVVRFERLPTGAVLISVAGYPKVDLTEDDFNALRLVFGA